MDDTTRNWSASDDDDRPPAARSFELNDPGGLLAREDAAWVRAHAERALAELARPGEVRVLVVDDAAMGDAHERYAGVVGTTDVLTFDLSDGRSAAGAALDADIYVCADEACRQAGARGHEPKRELLLYILHGVLHCLGYDDHDDDRYAAMHAAEDALLERLGVGATFTRASAGGGGGP